MLAKREVLQGNGPMPADEDHQEPNGADDSGDHEPG
jgi:hypothetical protein